MNKTIFDCYNDGVYTVIVPGIRRHSCMSGQYSDVSFLVLWVLES